MKLHSSRIMMFVLIGVLFLSISSVYAETAEDYYISGNIYYLQGNPSQAISDLTKAIQINPNYARAYECRAFAYFASKEYDKAWADVHQAESLGYKVPSGFIEKLKKASGRGK